MCGLLVHRKDDKKREKGRTHWKERGKNACMKTETEDAAARKHASLPIMRKRSQPRRGQSPTWSQSPREMSPCTGRRTLGTHARAWNSARPSAEGPRPRFVRLPREEAARQAQIKAQQAEDAERMRLERLERDLAQKKAVRMAREEEKRETKHVAYHS
ncbi:hypothetical protein F5148DRAFT_1235856 [Russula earlei]|uniref:Uncharacterized protein n=1 Tax=Russula earlei TaxID=71964 RepID=A0ACC0TXB8_9AGAM|nr:hypothetical protein F5148DRAFT_1235856 [Russula earlei]